VKTPLLSTLYSRFAISMLASRLRIGPAARLRRTGVIPIPRS
jgi:hypothetical protein